MTSENKKVPPPKRRDTVGNTDTKVGSSIEAIRSFYQFKFPFVEVIEKEAPGAALRNAEGLYSLDRSGRLTLGKSERRT